MTTSGPGRPRDPRIEEAVLSATRGLLVEVGYGRLSYELIAKRAGVTRPTLYRRWPTKAHIVHDAVFLTSSEPLWGVGNDFAADLRRMIDRLVRSYARPEAQAAVPGLLADLDDPELRHSVLDALQQPVRARFAERVAQAVAAGEARPGLDPDLLMDVIIGTVLQRVVAQQQLGRGLAGDLVELLLAGVHPREKVPVS